MKDESNQGWVIWLTGISGSGKTTLAKALEGPLREAGKRVFHLDGDVIRDFFEGDLGFSRDERIQNVRRIAFAAKVLADSGACPLVSNIAPYYVVRDFIRRKIPRYFQIYCQTTVETVIARDVKGHYRKFQAGEMTNIVGLDDPYDEPRNPDISVRTDLSDIDYCREQILAVMKERGIL